MKNVELLLPVGNYQMCLAAIHNGADAIYVGMPGFNARGRSYDHEWSELEEIIHMAHLYDVKVHLAFNILIFQTELDSAIKALDRAVSIGVDALIIQDLGLARLVRTRYPELTIHGSTQMSITNHEAIELLDDLNIKRFVLGRENSIDEIKIIKEKTNKELEVFVHGALCVAYSGQCFTSEALGGRSANRGQCAQSCRFDYELYVDGKKEKLVEQKYLVSPKDLCGLDEVSRLKEIGVDSFKIEGRLKSPEYVATTAKNYKKALEDEPITIDERSKLAVSYSRGFFSGWLNGVSHQNLVSADYNSNRGYFLGETKVSSLKNVLLESEIDLNAGDGLLFVLGEEEFGEKIYQIDSRSNLHKITLGPKFKTFEKLIGKKVKVYLTRSEGLIKEVKKSVTDKNLLKRIPIELNVIAKIGEPFKIIAVCNGLVVEQSSEQDLEKAKNNNLDVEDLKKKIQSLSHTVYKCQSLELDIDENVFLHSKVIKQIKQKIVEDLNSQRLRVKRKTAKTIEFPTARVNETKRAKLNVLVRKIAQVNAVIEFYQKHPEYLDYLSYVILDFEFGKDYFSAVKLLKENNIKVAIATTRILKPTEYHNFRLIERCKPDAILVRNLGALNYFSAKDICLIGDFSLNCANSVTHEYLINKGLKSQCLSYDLNLDQLNSLIESCEAGKTEITIHQYMPEFHMEHCVFAAFLSEGNSFRDCGKPCEKHEVHLKDMYGHRHEIKADQECRNTMFTAEAKSSVKYLDLWQNKGVGLFRMECLHESNEEVKTKLAEYSKVLSQEISSEQLYNNLGKLETYGLGIGQLENKKRYKDRKKSK